METIESLLKQAAEYASQGDVNRVEKLFVAALEEDPTNTDIMAHLGYFYTQTNRIPKALAIFEQRNQLLEPDAAACRMMGDLYWKLKDRLSSNTSYRQAYQKGDKSFSLLYRIYKSIFYKWGEAAINSIAALTRKCGFWKTYRTISFLIGWWLIFGLEQSKIFPSFSPFSLSCFLKFLWKYDPDGMIEGYAYHKTREAMLASSVMPWDNSSACLLDIGTGKNSLPLFWAMGNAQTIVLDGSDYGFNRLNQVQSRIEEEKSILPFAMLSGDGCSLPFKTEAFDAVSILCVLEHIPQRGDIQCMEEIFRVLKPGGQAIVTVETDLFSHEAWMTVPYDIGYQLEGNGIGAKQFEEVFCRNYSPTDLQERLVNSVTWIILEEGYYDDTFFPFRRWNDPKQHRFLSSILSGFQPLLSNLFYRKKTAENLFSSSIGYLVLQKPNVKSC